MRRLFLAAAVAVMAAAGAGAQSFEWGARAGVNVAWQVNEELVGGGDTYAIAARDGLYAGVFAEMITDGFFGVQGELLYSQMGNQVNRHKRRIDYIVLPMVAKVYPLGVSRGFSIDFGPQVGYMLSARDGNGRSFYKRGDLRKFEAAFVIGLSYKFACRFDISTRCTLGETKVYGNISGNANRALSLGLGYRF